MDALETMFSILVRALRADHPKLLRSAFTVGELHQQILPYRHFRRELGLETNQEYELILMELLSGERKFLDVDERLKDVFGKELASPNPDPSRVREFADAQISVNGAALAALEQREKVGGGGAQPRSGPASAAIAGVPHDATRCRYCGGELPHGRSLHFCPHCGQNLQVRNCPACGAEVEAGWKFCVVCGKSVA